MSVRAINYNRIKELKRKTTKACDPTGEAIIFELIDYICMLQKQIIDMDTEITNLRKEMEGSSDDGK